MSITFVVVVVTDADFAILSATVSPLSAPFYPEKPTNVKLEPVSLFDRLLEASGGLEALSVPHVFQSTSYSCGAAALLSIFRYWRLPAESERQIMKPLGTNWKRGTEAPTMAALARHLGLRADLVRRMTIDDLRRRVRGGETVIVEFQARPSANARIDKHAYGHYVVVVTVDNGSVYFMDPRVRAPKYGHVPIETFKRAWIDADGIRGLAVAIRGAKGLGKKAAIQAVKVRTGREPKAESLYDRAIGANAAMIPGSDGQGYALPMKNDLPGNMNPRDAVAGTGTRWHNKRLARGPERSMKAPWLMKLVGTPEQGTPPGARRPA